MCTEEHTYIPLVVNEQNAWSTSLLKRRPSFSTGVRVDVEDKRGGVGVDVLGGMARIRDVDILALSSSPAVTGTRMGTGMGRNP